MKPPTSGATGPKTGMPNQGGSKVEAGESAALKADASKGGTVEPKTGAGGSGPVGGSAKAEPTKPVAPEAVKSGPTLSGVSNDAPRPGPTGPASPQADAPKPVGAASGTAAPNPGAPKTDTPRTDTPRTDTPKTEPSKTEPPKADAAKPDLSKPDLSKPGTTPGTGPQPTARTGAVEDGPIIDLKAKRLSEPGEAARTENGKPSASPGKPAAEAVGAARTATPPAKVGRGLGFGSVVSAGLLGGLVGAGLLFAADRTGVLGPRGEDPRLAALDQRIGTLAPRDALKALDTRIAANETALKPLPEAVRSAETLAREALQKAGSVPAAAVEPGTPAAASEGGAPVASAPALPPDLTARLDSLDQRLAALQEEPGREQPADSRVAAISPGADVAALEQRLKAVEGKVEAAPKAEAQPDLGSKLATLQGDLDSRTKANADADQALGEKLAALQKSLDARVQAATESVQAATQATRLATEAGKAEAQDAAKAMERQLQAQADRMAALDKAVAERAETATVQAALRVVSADRITAALETGAPYADALGALRSMEPGDPARLTAVAVFADKGAPTARSLAAEFRPIAERIAAARKASQAKSVAETGDIAKRFASMAESIVQVRRVDAPTAETAAGDPTPKVQEALDRGAIAEAAQAFAAMPEDLRAQAGEFATKLKSRAAAAEAAQGLLADAFKGLAPPPAAR